jgi:tRNA 2-thiouridine synthesizing protein A
MSNTIQELDARKLSCPLPILRAKKALDGMEPGHVLRILATDPGAVMDFESFCKQTGNELLSSEQNGGEYVFQIRKK